MHCCIHPTEFSSLRNKTNDTWYIKTTQFTCIGCIKNLQNVMSQCRLSQNLRQPSHLIVPVSYNNNNNPICNAPDASVTDPEARKVAFTQVE